MDPVSLIDKVYHDILSMPVLWRGLWASVLISLVCSTLSVYVVLKRLAFIGQGIAHSALGGVALGILLFASGPTVARGTTAQLGIDITTAVFCLIVAWLIAWTSRKRIISEDTAIGIFFVASMALGVVLIALRRTYTAELFSFLFGSVLAVTVSDIYITAILAVVILAAVVIFYRPLFLFCLDEEIAAVAGMPVRIIHYGLLSALALTIVISMKVLGVLLVAAFLVIPAASARLLTHRYRYMFILANILGLLAVLGGLMLSDIIEDLPSGPTIVLCQFVIFLLTVLWSRTKASIAPGRELAIVGTSIVVLVYLVALYLTASVGYAATGEPKPSAAEVLPIDQTDWDGFITAVKGRHFDLLQQKMEDDPALAEVLTDRIEQSNLAEHEKAQLIGAILNTQWDRLSDELIQKLTAKH